MIENSIEVRAFADRFRALVREWGLDTYELALLLGQPETWEMPPSFASLPVNVETRMRLLLQLDDLLRVGLCGMEVADWLRSGFDGTEIPPLVFLSLGIEETRAMRDAARMRISAE